MEKTMISVSEMQSRLGVSRPMAYQLVNKENFPAIRIGRKILIPIKQLDRWIDEQVADKAN